MLKTVYFIAFTAMALPVFGQSNSIQATPFQFLLGKFSVQYERKIGPKNSLVFEYQRWKEYRSTKREDLIFFPLLYLYSGVYPYKSNFGHRYYVFYRQYFKKALKGGFWETGLYMGKHKIKVEEIVVEKKYHVTAYGVRGGIGLHYTIEFLSIEGSLGLSLNGNSDNVHPTLGMKTLSPYGRMAVGFCF